MCNKSLDISRGTRGEKLILFVTQKVVSDEVTTVFLGDNRHKSDDNSKESDRSILGRKYTLTCILEEKAYG